MNILWGGMWACGQFSTGLSHAASHQSLFAEATRASELPNMALPPLPNVLLMSAPINLWFNTKAPVKWTWARILFCQLGGDEKDRIASLWISNARIIGRTSFSYLPSSCNVGIIGNQSVWALVCSTDPSLFPPSHCLKSSCVHTVCNYRAVQHKQKFLSTKKKEIQRFSFA